MIEKLFYSIFTGENGKKAVRFENYVYEEEINDELNLVRVLTNGIIVDGGGKYSNIRTLDYVNKVYSRHLKVEKNLYSDFLVDDKEITEEAVKSMEHGRVHRSIHKNPINNNIEGGKYYWDVAHEFGMK